MAFHVDATTTKIISFQEFRRRMSVKHGIDLPVALLHAVYKLAKERQALVAAIPEEKSRSRELRRKILPYTKLVKAARDIEAQVKKLKSRAAGEGFKVDRWFSDTTEGLQELVAALERARQGVIDRIFPSLAHPYEQRWEFLLRASPMERLGDNAPRTWFLLNAYDLVFHHYHGSNVRGPKKHTWVALQALMSILFNESVELVTIERLVRTVQKNR